MSVDPEKISKLIHHWMDHNRAHRDTYLEWKEKLTEEGLPDTVRALEKVAELTLEANQELEKAAAELEERR